MTMTEQQFAAFEAWLDARQPAYEAEFDARSFSPRDRR
jgi:hypothetical protein